ncbi:MAG TPA: hypothetical protein VGO00_11875 [Kofleriaceae bacterium]|nr:hypothetical protein [Kofleriaceae bacterium]
MARGAQFLPGMSFAIRMLVTLAILVPYWLIRMPHETAEIFVVAFIAFGVGRIVAYMIDRKPTVS